jgi:hypothetical protein
MLQKPFRVLDPLAFVRHNDAEAEPIPFGNSTNLYFSGTAGVLNHVA